MSQPRSGLTWRDKRAKDSLDVGSGMRYAQSIGLAVLLALVTVGCGGSNSLPSQTLSGTWEFTSTSSAFPGTTYQGTAELLQTGSAVTGTVSFSDNPCATNAKLTGTITGSTVSFQVTEGDQVVTLNGSVNSRFFSISGSYTGPAGGCVNGDYGSWTASIG